MILIGKLGKLPRLHDDRNLKAENYFAPLAGPLPIIPNGRNLAYQRTTFPMFKNNELGDCTCAAAGHVEQTWSYNSRGAPFPLTDDDILKAYQDACGYVPGDPSTDRGGFLLDVLKYWRKTGIGGHTIDAFVEVQIDHTAMVRACVHHLGGLYLGLGLPNTAKGQRIWDVTDPSLTGDAKPWSWGGHAVNIVAFDGEYVTVVTWGRLQRMTWRFLLAYADEGYGMVSRSWLGEDGLTVTGFDISEMANDAQKVAA